MADYSVNKPIWPGSSSFSPGSTPFGFFDNDAMFKTHADSFAKHAAQNVGYPIMDVELIDINLDSLGNGIRIDININVLPFNKQATMQLDFERETL